MQLIWTTGRVLSTGLQRTGLFSIQRVYMFEREYSKTNSIQQERLGWDPLQR